MSELRVYGPPKVLVVAREGFLVRPMSAKSASRAERSRDPLDTTDPSAVVVRWRELVRLEALDPWPRVRVVYRHVGGESAVELPPVHGVRLEEFALDVEQLFVRVAEIRPHTVHRGWLDVPDVPWERVVAMPGDARPVRPEGAFRTASPAGPVVLAARHPQEPLPTGADGVETGARRSSDRERIGVVPLRVEVTDDHVYAVLGPAPHRIARKALRLRRDRGLAYASYVFGRRTELRLPIVPSCPVMTLLDGDLARTAPSCRTT